MVYGKRRRYSKRRFGQRKRRSFRGRRSIKLIRRVAKGAIRRAAETKFVYVAGVTNTAEANSPIVAFMMPSISQGPGAGQRIGNRVMCMRNSVRGSIFLSGVGSNVASLRVRVIIGRFKDLQGSPSNLDIANVLDVTTAGTKMNSQINFDVFQAYYDKMKRISTTNNVGFQTYGFPAFFDWKTSIKWRKSIGFQDDSKTPNINDYDKYLVFVLLTDQISSGQVTMSSSYQMKYTYLDM